MLSTIYSAGLCGIDGFIVSVECDAQERMSGFEIVGLPDLAVKEAKERVRTATLNSGFRFPFLQLTVNLAPADRKKEGSAFDVAILTGILRCAGVIRRDVDLSHSCLLGELSLSGAFAAYAVRFPCAWLPRKPVLPISMFRPKMPEKPPP